MVYGPSTLTPQCLQSRTPLYQPSSFDPSQSSCSFPALGLFFTPTKVSRALRVRLLGAGIEKEQNETTALKKPLLKTEIKQKSERSIAR